MKKRIKQWINRLGYDVTKRADIADPLHYNTAAETDRFYADAASAKRYVQEQVPTMVAANMQVIDASGIDLAHKSVLDVGCGTGHFLQALQQRFPTARVHGTEHSQQALALARSILPNAAFYEFDLTKYRLPQQFHFISCMHVLEHIADTRTALQNLAAMLKPGGYLLLAVPDGRTDNFPGHVHFWGAAGWPLMLRDALPNHTIVTGPMTDGALYALVQPPA